MIKNRKLKGNLYNPLNTLTLQAYSDPQEIIAPTLPLAERLNNYSDKIRQQTLVFLANLSQHLNYQEICLINDSCFVNQVLCRFQQTQPTILHAALYAITSLCTNQLTKGSYLTIKVINNFQYLAVKLSQQKYKSLISHYYLCLSKIIQQMEQQTCKSLNLDLNIQRAFDHFLYYPFPTARFLCLCSEISINLSYTIAKYQNKSTVLRKYLKIGQQNNAKTMVCDCLLNIAYRVGECITEQVQQVLMMISQHIVKIVNSNFLEQELKLNLNIKPISQIQQQNDWEQQQGEQMCLLDNQKIKLQDQKLSIWKQQAQSLLWVLQDLVDILDQDQTNNVVRKAMQKYILSSLSIQQLYNQSFKLLSTHQQLSDLIEGISSASTSILHCLKLKPIPFTSMVQKSIKLTINKRISIQSLKGRLLLVQSKNFNQILLLDCFQFSIKIQDTDLILVVLQIVGQVFNAQKIKQSFQNINKVGTLLIKCLMAKNQTINAQALDTLFDVFCNEDYDEIFKMLGLMGILRQGLKHLQKKQDCPQFIRQVAIDLKRFISYKKKNGC